MSEQKIVTPTLKRTVVVYSTSLGKKFVIETEATTYGELKEDLMQVIPRSELNLDNSKVFEGYAKLAFESEATQLPTNITTPQGVTNNLTLIIAPKQKMKSGMNRTELYAAIKNLVARDGEKAKNHFNATKNYTNKSTDELATLVNSYAKKASKAPIVKKETIIEKPQKVAVTKVAEKVAPKEEPKTTRIPEPNNNVIQISKESFELLKDGYTHVKKGLDLIYKSGIMGDMRGSEASISELEKLARS